MNVLDNINTRIGDALKEDLCEGATLCLIAENFWLSFRLAEKSGTAKIKMLF